MTDLILEDPEFAVMYRKGIIARLSGIEGLGSATWSTQILDINPNQLGLMEHTWFGVVLNFNSHGPPFGKKKN
jgi:hypothetical protein